MSHRSVLISHILLYVVLFASTVGAQLPVVRIGIVVDGPWVQNQEMFEAFREEIFTLTRGEFDVRFPEDIYVEGDWTEAGIKSSLDRLLGDPSVDLVLAMGVIVGDMVCRYPELPRPVIAPFIIDAGVQGLPRTDGASGVSNLSYLTGTITIRRALEVFKEITPFRHLVSLNTRDFLENVPGLHVQVDELMKEFTTDLTVMAVGPSAEEALAAIPEGADAVMVYPLLRLSEPEMEKLIAGLNERKLPTFAMYLSRQYVERGMLAGLSEEPIPRRARRVALNVQRILLGEDAGTFAVDFPEREALIINMATARAINVYPSFALETVGELINQERKGVDRHLNLRSAMEEAIQANLDLAANEREVAAGEKEIPIASSARLPQLEIAATGIIIDEDRATATFQPERVFSPSLTLTQLIYSDSANANVTIQRRFQEAREHDRERLRLDIAQEAASTYLGVLRTKTTERILKNNLEVTRSNLQLARVREAIGAAGPAEVYRWESEIAANRSEVITAAARRNQAEIALNRILNRPVEEGFLTDEIDLADPLLQYVQEQIRPYLSSRHYFSIFRDFMVTEGLGNAPELLAFDAAIAARERSLTASRRSFFAPDIVFQGSVERPFRGGASSSGLVLPPDLFPGADFALPNDIDWTLFFDISLPLFTSGERPAVRDQDIEELSRLRFERASTAERIEQRIRSALHRAGASFAGIRLAEQAAEAAGNNLDLVTDSYSRGAVSIIDLLDAQNAFLVADEAAENALYDFLIDLMEAERSVGRLCFLMEPEEREALFERADAFCLELGAIPPRR
jgi:outer membrane protein TolC